MPAWIYLVIAIICFGFILFLIIFSIIIRKDIAEGFKKDPPKPYKRIKTGLPFIDGYDDWYQK